MKTSKLHRDSTGRLPAYALSGGYPMIYLVDDGEALCPACANGENGSGASEDALPRSGWRIVAADVHWEGAPLVCAHCSAEIESAYGDPSQEGGAS